MAFALINSVEMIL